MAQEMRFLLETDSKYTYMYVLDDFVEALKTLKTNNLI